METTLKQKIRSVYADEIIKNIADDLGIENATRQDVIDGLHQDNMSWYDAIAKVKNIFDFAANRALVTTLANQQLENDDSEEVRALLTCVHRETRKLLEYVICSESTDRDIRLNEHDKEILVGIWN